jgi:uncharacterized membrane protein YbhN (UPF0104 family)
VSALDVVARLRRAAARARPWLLPLAFVAFVLTAGVAFASLPDGIEVHPWPLVLSALLVCPLSTAANAAEFAATAVIVGERVRPAEALRVAVISSAANLLPLPGAVAVRTHRLRKAAGYRRALAVTAAAGICWLGTALLFAGVADLVAAGRGASAVAVAAGSAGLVVSAAMIRDRRWWWVLASEVGQVAVGAARLGLAVAALDVSVGVRQSLGLAVAPVAGSALGILPGGLGVREAIAATIAALVDLPAAVGGAAAAVDRVLGLVVVAALVPLAGASRAMRVLESPSPGEGEETPA